MSWEVFLLFLLSQFLLLTWVGGGRQECEVRGATIVYATHIFDGLHPWLTHLAFISQGRLLKGTPFLCTHHKLPFLYNSPFKHHKLPLHITTCLYTSQAAFETSQAAFFSPYAAFLLECCSSHQAMLFTRLLLCKESIQNSRL